MLLAKPTLVPYTLEDHHAAAKTAALEGIVLMKNEGSLLPLKPGVQAAVIGDFAKTPRIQGQAPVWLTPPGWIPPWGATKRRG